MVLFNRISTVVSPPIYIIIRNRVLQGCKNRDYVQLCCFIPLDNVHLSAKWKIVLLYRKIAIFLSLTSFNY